MRAIKQKYGLKMAAFTFVYPGNKQIASMGEKHLSLEDEGIDYLIEYPFTDEIRMTDGHEFLKNLLIDKMKMAWIVAGDDCSFGYNKSGNAELLRKFSSVYDYKVTIIQKIQFNDTDISSTMIRQLLSEGDVDRIYKVKGNYYSLSGQVEHYKNLGKKLGFPTANISPPGDKILPKPGVYATTTQLEDGRVLSSMTNIGYNPTVCESDITGIKCETHIFDFDEDIYGQIIKVAFIRFIREEKRFNSLDALKIQLQKDKDVIKQCFNQNYMVKGET